MTREGWECMISFLSDRYEMPFRFETSLLPDLVWFVWDPHEVEEEARTNEANSS
jgi:hypothetical protein